MLASERHTIILAELARHPAVSIRALTEKTGVSRETIRKDIELLAQQQKLSQVRGGATKIQTQEPSIESRSLTNPEGKARIANYVASQIPDGASVIIDNGSTTLATAKRLADTHQNLIVYTNDLRIAEVISPATRELVFLGGRIVVSEMATLGLEVMESLARYRAEFALVSAGGLSEKVLFTDFSREAATLRHQMLSQAQKPFLLADNSKFGAIGQVVLNPVPKGTNIIVDKMPPKNVVAELRKKQLLLHVAS